MAAIESPAVESPAVGFRVSWIKRRSLFPALLNTRPQFNQPTLLRSAVEIGTHRGEFAEQFLNGWQLGTLYCVDPWIDGEKGVFDQPDAWGDRNEDYRECVRRLAKFGRRAVIMRKTSAEAVADFRDGSLDFVYIDGNHRRPFVDGDIRLWWPKVKSGGILAGHDLTGIWEGQVKPAVTEFAEREGIKVVWIVLGEKWRGSVYGDCASWWVSKE